MSLLRRTLLLSLPVLPFAGQATAQAMGQGAGQARRWRVDPARSVIAMRIRVAGLTQTGRFEDWSGDIRFDPATPSAAQVSIAVRAASLRMREAALSARATGPVFLDAERWPTIRFQLIAFEPADEGRYTARAAFTIKGRTREIVFPADLRVRGDTAQMTGGFPLDRAAWDIGMQGPWNALIGRQVRVDVSLTARSA